MDLFLVIGCVCILLLLIGYIIIKIYLYRYRNPTTQNLISQPNHGDQSIVTHTYIGKRGDMGNQIFQLACIMAAAERSNAKVILPSQINTLPIVQLFDLSLFSQETIIPDQTYYEYDNYELIDIPKDGRSYDIRGYRQAYKYFDDHANQIRKIFTPKLEILAAVRAILPPRYLAVHIRRGDYIKKIHNIPLFREFKQCQLAYYKEGIRILRMIYPELPILICTDSPKWVTPLLGDLDPLAKLTPTLPEVQPKFSDFCALYLAEGVVMSNSTYSWWAAYLRNNRPIICPTPWWDPRGFIGTGMGLNGPYLHYPEWLLLDADTGAIKRQPHSQEGEEDDTNSDTLDLYRMIRGVLL